MLRKALFVFCLLFSFAAYAATLTLEQKLADFHQLVDSIDNSYGPKFYKEEQGIASLKTLVPKYEAEISQTETDDEFHYAMVRFVAEFKDGHFGISAPFDFAQYPPFNTDLVNGRVLITKIDDATLPEDLKGKLAVGDEVLSVNNEPINALLNRLSKHIPSGQDNTIRRIAAWTVLSRRSNILPGFTNDEVEFEIKKGDSKIREALKVKLTAAGERLPSAQILGLTRPQILQGEQYFQQMQILSTENMLRGAPQAVLDRSFMCSGGSRIDRPKDATVIVEKPFVAHYYPTEKGNIGYLRIPHYSPYPESEEEKSVSDIGALRMAQYQFAVQELEKNTVGLIIDQDHNCGGSVFWLEEFLGLFMDKPYEPMKFRFRASREEYLGWSEELENSKAYESTIWYKHWTAVVELVKTHWLMGDYLTDFSSFSNATYQPNSVRYTKPIIVLIDELSGSGGDAFPSLIQGYGRAKLLGTTTSGLGGHVVPLPPLTFSRMQIRITKSMFYRPDGVPVENNGAVPDIPYSITEDDIRYGFRPYREFYTEKILEEVEAAKPQESL